MASIDLLLSELSRLRVRVWAENGALRLKAPKDVLTPQLKHKITAHKDDLLHFLEQNQAPAAPPPSTQTTAPLALNQAGLWFLEHLNPGNPAWHIPIKLHLHGHLNPSHLSQALAQVVQTQDLLRTRIDVTAGEPGLLVDEAAAPVLHLVEHATGETLNRLLDQMDLQPFDLTREAPVRIGLFRLGETTWLLNTTFHHIMTDGWSLGLFFDAWSTAYHRLCCGENRPLTRPAYQFADAARDQHAALNSAAGKRHRDWWRRYLDGAPDVLNLPTRGIRPSKHDSRGGHHQITLPAPLWGALTRRSTAFPVLRSLLTILLGRWCGQDDFLLASVTAGRGRPALEPLVGYFVNTMAVRCRLPQGVSFRQLLAAAEGETAQLLDHAELPFEQVVHDRQPQRLPGRLPLVQVEFVVQNLPLEPPCFHGLEVIIAPEPNRFIRYDLEFQFREVDGALHCALTWSRALFDADFGNRLNGGLLALAEAVAANPDQPAARLPILDHQTRQHVLVTLNQTQAPHTVDLMARLRSFTDSQRTALVETAGETKLSYAQLWRQAHALAGQLQAAGVGWDDRVGLLLEPSFDLIIAVLAVLEVGACYVPLDPDYPEDRLRLMVDDAKPAVVLTPERPSWLPTTAQIMDPRVTTQAAPSRHGDPPALAGAYMIYTSGSTGRPKGVMVSRGALCNTMVNVGREPGFSADDVLLAVTTPSFDNAVLDFFTPLFNGGVLVLADRLTCRDGHRMARAMVRHGVTFLSGTPAHWRLLTQAEAALPPGLRGTSSGEALAPDVAAQILERTTSLHNQYGPTEAAVWVSGLKLAPADLKGPSSIGRPMGNVRALILDPRMEPLPPGVSGELFIGGAGVARGYHNQPALTAQRFVPDPWSQTPGARLYQSGDRAAWSHDGRLLFQGRLDHQIKLRGYRIEPGEIEAALTHHPGVSQAAVQLVTQGDPHLAAFIVPGEPTPNVQALRDMLARKLPGPMIPKVYTFLKDMPRTPSGKLDRNQLITAPQQVSPEKTKVTTSTRAAQILAEIWAETLELEPDRIDTGANFFDLGGHSLQVAGIMGRINRRLDLKLEAVDMFTKPTIAAMAQFIENKQGVHHQAEPARTVTQPVPQSRAMAVIGMAGRFPDAPDLETFAANLFKGHVAVRDFSDEHLINQGLDPTQLNAPDLVKSGTVLDHMDCFDAAFFEISPKDAAMMDPQHRLFLETAWHALEDAGLRPGEQTRRLGLFAGVGPNKYLLHNLAGHAQEADALGALHGGVGNEKDFLATRAAYKLNLKGPAMAVQTGCSSSLAALHTAVTAILDGACDGALVGGVSLEVPHAQGYRFQPGGILSPDGRCRSFDVHARGTVEGSAVAVVVIKPLDRAQADGDRIHAVLRATALNNDGAAKMGFTAAGVDGPADVMRDCLRLAATTPDQLGYLVANGTATPMGDPLELKALQRGLGQTPGPMPLGAAKAAIGHGGAVSGLCSLIQAILAVRQGVIPPIAGFNALNPEIEPGPFTFPSQAQSWPQQSGPAMAGVVSFGIGGTNACALVEAPPKPLPVKDTRPVHLWVWSAATAPALARMRDRLGQWFHSFSEPPLGHAAYTLAMGRAPLPHRGALLIRAGSKPTFEAAQSGLAQRIPLHLHFPAASPPSPELAAHCAVYRDAVTRLTAAWKRAELRLKSWENKLRELGQRHNTRLKRTPTFDPTVCFEPGEADELTAMMLKRDALRYPVGAIAAMAASELLRAMDLQPDTLTGGGPGQHVVTWFQGNLCAEGALTLVGAHGRLLQLIPGEGACLDAHAAPAFEARQLLESLIESLEPASDFDVKAAVDAFFHNTPSAEAAEAKRLEPAFDSLESLLNGLSDLWLSGFQPNWAPLYADTPASPVSMPGYPFERTRHWIDPLVRPSVAHTDPLSQALARRMRERGLTAPEESSQTLDAMLDELIDHALNQGLLLPKNHNHSKAPRRLPADFEPPMGRVEQSLAGWWSACLGLEPIGRKENLFHLGANSLTAAMVQTRIMETYELTIPLRTLMNHQTIAAQALALNPLRDSTPKPAREQGEI